MLVSLALQTVSAVVQLGEVGAAGGEVQAQAECGGDHARQEDRVKSPFAAGEQGQPGDHGKLEQAAAARRDRSAVTVYTAMSRASPSTRCLSHNAAPMEAATTQPNTAMGQVRRTISRRHRHD